MYLSFCLVFTLNTKMLCYGAIEAVQYHNHNITCIILTVICGALCADLGNMAGVFGRRRGMKLFLSGLRLMSSLF